jgi:hypothetical protein
LEFFFASCEKDDSTENPGKDIFIKIDRWPVDLAGDYEVSSIKNYIYTMQDTNNWLWDTLVGCSYLTRFSLNEYSYNLGKSTKKIHLTAGYYKIISKCYWTKPETSSITGFLFKLSENGDLGKVHQYGCMHDGDTIFIIHGDSWFDLSLTASSEGNIAGKWEA